MAVHPLAAPPSAGFPTTSWHPLSRQAPPIDSRQQRYYSKLTKMLFVSFFKDFLHGEHWRNFPCGLTNVTDWQFANNE